MYLGVYVDDILTYSPKGSRLRKEWAAKFSETFDWTDFGKDLHEFLSVQVTQSPDSVEIGMQRYIESCVSEAFPGGTHAKYETPATEDLARDVAKASNAKDTTYATSPAINKHQEHSLYTDSRSGPQRSG